MDIKNLGYNKIIENVTTIEEAKQKVEGALKNNEFGITSEINVSESMREKLKVDFPDYIILGACNPKMAHKALGIDQYLGLFLPCNVIVFRDKEGKFNASFTKPAEMFKFIDKAEMKPIAEEVDRLIKAAYEEL